MISPLLKHYDRDDLPANMYAHLQTLSDEEILGHIMEHEKYCSVDHKNLIYSFLAGVTAYTIILSLLECSICEAVWPFKFMLPHGNNQIENLYSGNALRYFSVPLSAVYRTTTGVISQLCSYVQYFINVWDAVFLEGPEIPHNLYSRLSLDVMVGVTNHSSTLIEEMVTERGRWQKELKATTEQLIDRFNVELRRQQREIHNLKELLYASRGNGESRTMKKTTLISDEKSSKTDSVSKNMPLQSEDKPSKTDSTPVKSENSSEGKPVDTHELVKNVNKHSSTSYEPVLKYVSDEQMVIDSQPSEQRDSFREYHPPRPKYKGSDIPQEAISDTMEHHIEHPRVEYLRGSRYNKLIRK
jgi:hypothetical protein